MMSPVRKAAQRLAHAERRKRAFQAAQIDGFFGHFHSRKLSPDTARALTRVVKRCALDPRLALRQKHRMVSDHPSPQRIARLAPLADVLAWIDANVQPVAPRESALRMRPDARWRPNQRSHSAIPSQAISLARRICTADRIGQATQAPTRRRRCRRCRARVDVGDRVAGRRGLRRRARPCRDQRRARRSACRGRAGRRHFAGGRRRGRQSSASRRREETAALPTLRCFASQAFRK